MSAGETVATPPDEAIINRLILLDYDYYRRNVSTHSHEESMVPCMDYRGSGDCLGHPQPGSALWGDFRHSDGPSTAPVEAETIKEISAAVTGIVSIWCRESKTRDYLRQSLSPPTTATNRPEESLSGLVESIRRDPRLRFRERLGTRLARLIEISREEQPEQAPPALASVRGLIAFLAANQGLKYPTVVLTPDGNVRVEWRQGRDRHFAIEFLNDIDVRFVVFASDPKRPYKVARVAGQASLDSVMTLVAPYRVRDWSAEQDEKRPGE